MLRFTKLPTRAALLPVYTALLLLDHNTQHNPRHTLTHQRCVPISNLGEYFFSSSFVKSVTSHCVHF